jgi:hypothetical protein
VTTVDQPHTDQLTADQLRADALRWVLTIADTHHLPVPGRIDTYQLTYGWHLNLRLDDDQGDDVHRWADALDLPMVADLHVNGAAHRWTTVSANGPAHLVFAGWESIRIESFCDFTAAVPVAALAVAA